VKLLPTFLYIAGLVVAFTLARSSTDAVPGLMAAWIWALAVGVVFMFGRSEFLLVCVVTAGLAVLVTTLFPKGYETYWWSISSLTLLFTAPLGVAQLFRRVALTLVRA
jgi:hypothetical protein